MKKFIDEFKKFINRGSVIDLAVGFIIGAAFKDIVNSLVKDILTPIISLIVGEEGFSNYMYVIARDVETNEVINAIYYGNFIQAILDFFIIALVVFLIVKGINKANERMEKAKVEVVEEVKEVVEEVKPKVEDILLDIKELLKPGTKKEE